MAPLGDSAGMVLYLAGLGPGATRVTSGIDAWLGLVRHRLPSSTAAEFDHAAQPSSEQLCEGRSEVGAGSKHHSLVGREVGPAVAWISA